MSFIILNMEFLYKITVILIFLRSLFWVLGRVTSSLFPIHPVKRVSLTEEVRNRFLENHLNCKTLTHNGNVPRDTMLDFQFRKQRAARNMYNRSFVQQLVENEKTVGGLMRYSSFWLKAWTTVQVKSPEATCEDTVNNAVIRIFSVALLLALNLLLFSLFRSTVLFCLLLAPLCAPMQEYDSTFNQVQKWKWVNYDDIIMALTFSLSRLNQSKVDMNGQVRKHKIFIPVGVQRKCMEFI